MGEGGEELCGRKCGGREGLLGAGTPQQKLALPNSALAKGPTMDYR